MESKQRMSDAAMEEIARACSRKNPNRRPQGLAEIANGLEVPSPKAERAQQTAGKQSTRRLGVLVVAGVLIGIATIGAYYFGLFQDLGKTRNVVITELSIVEPKTSPKTPPAIEEIAGTPVGDRHVQELFKAGRYSEAIPLAIQSLQLCEKALGPEHPKTATDLNNLGYLYATTGDYAKAEPLYQRALKIKEKALGPEHPSTAISLNNLALLYYHMGDYAKAKPLYERALKIREKALGLEHPSTAESLDKLGLLYQDMGEYAKAEPLYQRALKIKEKALGPDHPSTAVSHNN